MKKDKSIIGELSCTPEGVLNLTPEAVEQRIKDEIARGIEQFKRINSPEGVERQIQFLTDSIKVKQGKIAEYEKWIEDLKEELTKYQLLYFKERKKKSKPYRNAIRKIVKVLNRLKDEPVEDWDVFGKYR